MINPICNRHLSSDTHYFHFYKITILILIYWDGNPLANSADPDQTPHNAASDQDLLCLLLIQHFYKQQVVKSIFKFWNKHDIE